MLKEQRTEVAKRKNCDKESLRSTWRTVLRNNLADLAPLPKGPEIETHSSHTLMACGGWGGCVACGGMSSGGASRLLRRTCRFWMPPSTKRDIKKLANGTMPHFLVHSKWPDGSVAPAPRQWIPEVFNDVPSDAAVRATTIERYKRYMFAEPDTSSCESGTDEGDEAEGRAIAEMDDVRQNQTMNANRPQHDGKENHREHRKGWVKSSRFERYYDKARAVTKLNANL